MRSTTTTEIKRYKSNNFEIMIFEDTAVAGLKGEVGDVLDLHELGNLINYYRRSRLSDNDMVQEDDDLTTRPITRPLNFDKMKEGFVYHIIPTSVHCRLNEGDYLVTHKQDGLRLERYNYLLKCPIAAPVVISPNEINSFYYVCRERYHWEPSPYSTKVNIPKPLKFDDLKLGENVCFEHLVDSYMVKSFWLGDSGKSHVVLDSNISRTADTVLDYDEDEFNSFKAQEA